MSANFFILLIEPQLIPVLCIIVRIQFLIVRIQFLIVGTQLLYTLQLSVCFKAIHRQTQDRQESGGPFW
eukprot:Skav202435  [mRNA]  locus=scaffold2070:71416:72427:- [translate_table: standard]